MATRITVLDDNGTETRGIQINNANELREVAARFGVAVNEGPGRLPKNLVRAAIVANGYAVAGTEYFAAETSTKADAERVLRYVTAKVVVTGGFSEGVNDKGVAYKVPVKGGEQEVTLSLDVVRELTGTVGLKGRVSNENLRTAFRKHVGNVDAKVFLAL
jgi:hypothetical protein